MLGCYREQSYTWYTYSKGIKYIEKELELANVVKSVRGLRKENKSILLEDLEEDDDKTLLERDESPMSAGMEDKSRFETED